MALPAVPDGVPDGEARDARGRHGMLVHVHGSDLEPVYATASRPGGADRGGMHDRGPDLDATRHGLGEGEAVRGCPLRFAAGVCLLLNCFSYNTWEVKQY